MTRKALSEHLIALGDTVQKDLPAAAGLLYTISTAVFVEQDAQFLKSIDPQVKHLLRLCKLAGLDKLVQQLPKAAPTPAPSPGKDTQGAGPEKTS